MNPRYTFMKTKFLLFCFIAITQILSAQKSLQDSAISMITLEPIYAGYIPSGDMAKRFGFTSTAGMIVSYKLSNNLYFSGGALALFGGNVKDVSMLNNITASGFLIDNEGNFTRPRITETGFLVPFSFGKIIPMSIAPNKNSGLYIEAGPQFIQHKIWFNVPRNRVASLTPSYQKGYDRLSNGLGIHEGFGYKNFSNNSFLNFSLGFDFSQNFTQSRRSIDLDTGKRDTQKRLDLLFGIHATWIFPVYKEAPDKVYYY
jgi:hypothetical protein